MTTFTVADIAGSPEQLHEAVSQRGEVRLVAPDGREYVLRRALGKRPHPLRIRGVKTLVPITRDDIVDMLREMHEHEPEWMREMFERRERERREREVGTGVPPTGGEPQPPTPSP